MRWRAASANEMAQSGTSQAPLTATIDESDDVTSSVVSADDAAAGGITPDSVGAMSAVKPYHSRLDSDDDDDDDEEEDELFTDDDDGLREAARYRMKKRQHSPFGSADDPDDPGDSFPLNIHDEEGMDHSQPPPDDDNSSIEWRVQTSQSTCEFTHTILNYSQKRESGCKKAEYSATTVDEFGNRWRLIVYVNGNGRASNHHLSLFLQVADADDLPFGWKKAVSYVLTLEHPAGNNLSYAKRNPDKTFKLCPKAIDWGWSQFITSDRIQQEGFIQHDSLTVRACVTVKSSSVTIDVEDAELYLKCAVEEGNVEGVKLCLNQGAGVNCQFKDDLYTPLHTACSSASPTSTSEDGNMQVLELLLEKGADGNACNKWRETPLLIAANNGHRAAVEALLKHGADPSLCSEAGWSALTFAAHKGYDDIVALLLRAGAPVNCRVTEDSSTPLHKACAGSKNGHLTAVRQLLDGGADVHALNKWRETPLLTAANHGQAGAVEALLKAGADPCKCTDTGWSPLSIAAYKGHDDVVKLLLDEGAPTEEADPTLSALLQAATKGLPGTVELLLRHGADHTVTTKKGDTALSILVEQNLIDAAVEMVTEYKASIPRCSKDRKKVQRARLLINLRIKQMQKEGTYRPRNGSDDDYDMGDDAETDQEDGAESPQHGKSGIDDNEKGNGTSGSPRKKKKKKGGKKKLSPEEQAKAAEEALLLELEKEMAQAEKVQQEASKKSAKKRKKKERERMQKQKEEQERREREEKERLEKERQRKEKEEQQRKEREEKARIQREKEEEEHKKAMEAAAKRREKEEKERLRKLQLEKQRRAEQQKLQQERDRQDQQRKAQQAAKQQQQERQQARQSAKKQVAMQTADSRSASIGTVTAGTSVPSRLVSPAPAQGTGTSKNRGWETKSKPATLQAPHANTPPSRPVSRGSSVASGPAPGVGVPANKSPPGHGMTRASSDFQRKQDTNSTAGKRGSDHTTPHFLGFDSTPTKTDVPSNPFGEFPALLSPHSQQQQQQQQASDVFSVSSSGSNGPLSNGYHSQSLLQKPRSVDSMEHPAVAVLRKEKLAALIGRFSSSGGRMSTMDPLHVVTKSMVQRVLYRWIVRSVHDSLPVVDCMIPSWVDFNHLTTFFQRQFISESRKGSSLPPVRNSMMNMEALKEAGIAMASLCHSLANEVADFKRQLESQIPRDWSDSSVGMSAANSMQNGTASHISILWTNRSRVDLSSEEFARLNKKYVGHPNRILAAMFHLKMRYNTMQLVVDGTEMDSQFTAAFLHSAAVEAGAQAQLWCSPFSVPGGAPYWGQFPDVDMVFGASRPFGSAGDGHEDALSRGGGSVLVLPPMDSMVASSYTGRIISSLQVADSDRVPLCFVMVLRTECFHDRSSPPTSADLHLLDPRLSNQCRHYVRRAEMLVAGQHVFAKNDGSAVVCGSGSLLVILQNSSATRHYDVSDMSMTKLVAALSVPTQKLATPMSFAPVSTPTPTGDLVHGRSPSSDFLDAFAPMSSQGLNPAATEFGGIGGIPLSTAFSAGPPAGHDIMSSGGKSGSRRGPTSSRRLFDLVDDADDNLNDVDVVSGMLNNLNVDLFQNAGAGSQDVDIEAISLMGIGNPSAPSRMHRNGSHGRFG